MIEPLLFVRFGFFDIFNIFFLTEMDKKIDKVWNSFRQQSPQPICFLPLKSFDSSFIFLTSDVIWSLIRDTCI